jgi:alkanesulfonate monooxygenase SsuD/methylene tetrahydromethanopterin reductase-like flavin-dependent oxidoreductase (luciferase family)
MEARLGEAGRAVLAHVLSEAIVGSPAKVAARLADFVRRTGADEIMVTSSIFDHDARLRSFEIVTQAAAITLSRASDGAVSSSMA